MKQIFVSTRGITKGEPPIIVYEDGGEQFCTQVDIHGPSRVVWEPDGSGIGRFEQTQVWVETDAEVTLSF